MDTILVADNEVTVALAEELETLVEDTLRCTIVSDLRALIGEDLGLSLCNKED
jgi:hypothetical protein